MDLEGSDTEKILFSHCIPAERSIQTERPPVWVVFLLAVFTQFGLTSIPPRGYTGLYEIHGR
jgi:hypothetical protein